MKKRALLGQVSDVDIRLLRVFKVVVESGSFSAAELEMNIGCSTISRHIKDLEIRLGVSLCRRGRAGFALTEEGRQVYEAALKLLSSVEEFRSGVNEIHHNLTGQISIALFDKIATNPQAKLHAAIELFDDLAPEVDINVFIEPINDIEQGVIDGRFQIGLIPMHRHSSRLSYYQLFEEQMYLYCGEKHPLYGLDDKTIDRQDVINSKYVGLGYHSPNMETGRNLKQQRSATVFDQEAILHFIRSGRYLGYLPDHYANSFSHSDKLRPILTDIFQYQCVFEAVTQRSPKRARILQTFLSCLQQAHSANR
jgi:DNA-binding transcriptional LysR family regulator